MKSKSPRIISKTIFSAVALVGLLSVCATAKAEATLIGDDLTFTRAYPSLTTAYPPVPPAPPGADTPITVTTSAGTSDTVFWTGNGWNAATGTTYIRFNPESSSILVNIPNAGTYLDTAPDFFDGYIITGFATDILAASALYTGLTLTTLARELRLDFLGNIPTGDFTITLRLADGVTPVPEPGTLALLGLGLAGLAAARRRKR